MNIYCVCKFHFGIKATDKILRVPEPKNVLDALESDTKANFDFKFRIRISEKVGGIMIIKSNIIKPCREIIEKREKCGRFDEKTFTSLT